VRILFEVSGDVQLNRELLRVGGRGVDASPAFEAIADRILSEDALQLGSQGRHASGGWKPLQPATMEAKRRRNLRPEILRATDSLMRSLTVRGDSNQVLKVRPDGLDLGSKLPYAGAHQNPKPGSRLPQRRPVELTETTRRDITKTLQRFVLTGEVL
jgi:phage gpG-like protein